MSAKKLTIFIFKFFPAESILTPVAAQLRLTVDELPPDFPFQFSAKRNSGREYLLIEYGEDRNDLIEEISNWERINNHQKEIILTCRSSIEIHYRRKEIGAEALTAIGQKLSAVSSKCIVENGLGCLIPLETLLNCMQQDANWTWEKETFPELLSVAPSEWLE